MSEMNALVEKWRSYAAYVREQLSGRVGVSVVRADRRAKIGPPPPNTEPLASDTDMTDSVSVCIVFPTIVSYMCLSIPV